MFQEERDLEQIVRQRLKDIHEMASGSIGALMDYELISCDTAAGEYCFRCKTFPWMRNIPGTLHGGMCATILDQAMGFVAYCIKPGEGIAPTVKLDVNYHRSITPGDTVLVNVKVLSVTRSLMHISSQAFREKVPEKLCLSGSAMFFYKPLQA